jgi:hypothetical protein
MRSTDEWQSLKETDCVYLDPNLDQNGKTIVQKISHSRKYKLVDQQDVFRGGFKKKKIMEKIERMGPMIQPFQDITQK